MNVKYPEEQLISNIIRKDESAFEQLYGCYAASMFNIIFKMVKCVPTSEDILQNVFIKVWKNIYQYNVERGRLFTWLLNITRNEALDYLRSRYAKQTKVYDNNNERIVKYQNCITIQNHRIDITRILHLAPPKERAILLLITMGFTIKQISEIVNLPLSTVKGKIRSSYKKLRKVLAQNS